MVGTSTSPPSWTARVTAPSARVTELLLGMRANVKVACANVRRPSGSPMNSTVRAAASASTRPSGGQSNVLAREDHEAPREESRTLATLEHRDEPVQGSVGVRSSHRLDEGADLIEVRVARLMIETAVARLGDWSISTRSDAALGRGRARSRYRAS